MTRTAKVQSKNEQPQSMELVPSARVVQANELIRAKQDRLTIFEARLLRLAIAQILKDDTDFKTYKTTVTQLSKLLNIPTSNIRSLENIKSALLKLRSKNITIETEKEVLVFGWIDSVRIDKKSKTVIFRLNDDLKPYLLGLNELFTRYDYENLLELPTDYSIRLYELLYSYRSLDRAYKVLGEYLKKNEVAFTVDELREHTNCTDKYPNGADFIKRVIKPSVDAINEKTDLNLNLSYRTLKDGRIIKYIIFTYLSPIEYGKKQESDAKKKAQKSMQKLIKEKSL